MSYIVWPAAQEPQPALNDLIDMDDSFRDWQPCETKLQPVEEPQDAAIENT